MKKNGFKFIFYLTIISLSVFFIYSFIPNEYSVAEYFDYIKKPNSGYVKTQEIGELKFEFTYVPSEETVLKQNSNVHLNKTEFKKLCDEQNQSITFRVRIESLKGINPLRYNLSLKDEIYSRKKYYDFDFVNDVCLIQNGDTIPCELSQNFTNDLSNSIELMVIFSRKNYKEGNLIFSLNEIVFGTGIINQEYNQKILTVKPEINI